MSGVRVPTPTLITGLDQARSASDEQQVAASVERASALLDPPDPDSSFGARYLRVLQEHPATVLAHRDVTAALARLTDASGDT